MHPAESTSGPQSRTDTAPLASDPTEGALGSKWKEAPWASLEGA
jgi:hypothetical protein